MTDLRDALGLPLPEALELCALLGVQPQVCFTGENDNRAERTPRVIAIRENMLIAAYFKESAPKGGEE